MSLPPHFGISANDLLQENDDLNSSEEQQLSQNGRQQRNWDRADREGVRQSANEGLHKRNSEEDCLKGSKISFPSYDGTKDPIPWFSRAEKFFRLH